MTRIYVRRTKLVQSPSMTGPRSEKEEYLRYFRDLTTEYKARTSRLTARVMGGRTAKGSPDMNVDKPSWELDDVCCYTDITEKELRRVIPRLFDAYRELHRVQNAAVAAHRIPRRERITLAKQGREAMLDFYVPPNATRENAVERLIDGWLDGMFGTCQWPDNQHRRACRKPVPWTRQALGGGRSIDIEEIEARDDSETESPTR